MIILRSDRKYTIIVMLVFMIKIMQVDGTVVDNELQDWLFFALVSEILKLQRTRDERPSNWFYFD